MLASCKISVIWTKILTEELPVFRASITSSAITMSASCLISDSRQEGSKRVNVEGSDPQAAEYAQDMCSIW